MMHTLYFAFSFFFTGVYNYSLPSFNGGTINLDNYQGKKMLLVNIATQTPQSRLHLTQLQQFYALHQDSVVVIGILSNSFGHLNVPEQQIRDSLTSFNVQFPVATSQQVTGSSTHPLYQWLTQSGQNGVMSTQISGDFQKYLISRQGQLIGFFLPSVLPFSEEMREAVKY